MAKQAKAKGRAVGASSAAASPSAKKKAAPSGPKKSAKKGAPPAKKTAGAAQPKTTAGPARPSKTTARPARPSKAAASPRTPGPTKFTAGKAGARAPASGKARGGLRAPGSALPAPDGASKKAARAASSGKHRGSGASGPAALKTRAARARPTRARPAKRVTFDKKTLAGITESLLNQKKDLLEQLEDIEEAAFSPGQTEASSEAGFDEDYADAGTATFEREKDLSIANNITDLIDKIDKALAKIEQGSYGLCENCGQPISSDRLKALPHVSLCIDCKKAEERR